MSEKKHIDEMVKRLRQTGLKKNLAIALVFIARHDEVQSRDIEDATRLRQPEVSIATTELRERGWIKKRDKNLEGKGRPVHYYSLNDSLDEIIEDIEEEEREKVEDIESNLDRIKELKEAITS